jgi:hypothetical protein
MCGIYQLAAAGNEGLQNLAPLSASRRVVLEIENDRGTHTDDGQLFAAMRNRTRLEVACAGFSGARKWRKRGRKRSTCGGQHNPATGERHGRHAAILLRSREKAG